MPGIAGDGPFVQRGNLKRKGGCCPDAKKPTVEDDSRDIKQRDDQVRVPPHLQKMIKAHMAARALAKRKAPKLSY